MRPASLWTTSQPSGRHVPRTCRDLNLQLEMALNLGVSTDFHESLDWLTLRSTFRERRLEDMAQLGAPYVVAPRPPPLIPREPPIPPPSLAQVGWVGEKCGEKTP